MLRSKSNQNTGRSMGGRVSPPLGNKSTRYPDVILSSGSNNNDPDESSWIDSISESPYTRARTADNFASIGPRKSQIVSQTGAGGIWNESPPPTNRLDILRKSYTVSKLRAHELHSSVKSAVPLKIHGQQASRVYSVMSALIYASIGVAKAKELEKYIHRSSLQIPSSIFDLQEWKAVLDLARQCRLESAAAADKGASSLIDTATSQPATRSDMRINEEEQRVQEHTRRLLQKLSLARSDVHVADGESESTEDCLAELQTLKVVLAQNAQYLEIERHSAEKYRHETHDLQRSLADALSTVQLAESSLMEGNKETERLRAELNLLRQQAAPVQSSHSDEFANSAAYQSMNERLKLKEAELMTAKDDIKSLSAALHDASTTDHTHLVVLNDVRNQLHESLAETDRLHLVVAEHMASFAAIEESNTLLSKRLSDEQLELKVARKQASEAKSQFEQLTTVLEGLSRPGELGHGADGMNADTATPALRAEIAMLRSSLSLAEQKLQQAAVSELSYMSVKDSISTASSRVASEIAADRRKAVASLVAAAERSDKLLATKTDEISALQVKLNAYLCERNSAIEAHAAAESSLRATVSRLEETVQRLAGEQEALEKSLNLARTEADDSAAALRAARAASDGSSMAAVAAVATGQPASSSAELTAMTQSLRAAENGNKALIQKQDELNIKINVLLERIQVLESEAARKGATETRTDPAPKPVLPSLAAAQSPARGAEKNITNSTPSSPATPLRHPHEYRGVKNATSAQVIQRHIRGYITRARVYRMLLRRAAGAKGLLVAAPGTMQGSTGWYIDEGKYYYFCCHEGSFILLCGPLSEDMYALARSECREAWGTHYHRLKHDQCLHIDRLAVHATRMQIDLLTEEMHARTANIDELLRSHAQRNSVG